MDLLHVVVCASCRAGGRAACSFTEGRDVWYAEAIAEQAKSCEVEWVEAEHPLFLLYTSGSTGVL
jgi:acetyl-CoA synthetase